MNTVLWVLAGILAGVFVVAGTTKLTQAKEKLLENPAMGWAEPFPPPSIRAIGGLEILGAVGLVLPGLLDVATVLVPLSALGLAVTMVGAALVHLRRSEIPNVLFTVVLLAGCVVVAWGRFGPYPL